MTNLPDIIIFSDLDDSLFKTLRKFPESEKPELTIAARAAGGKDSYMNRKQSSVLKWLDVSRCVPVTARGTEAYSRVAIPFAGPAAIVANGAVILDHDGSINTAWAAHVSATLAATQSLIQELPDILQQLAADNTLDIRSWAVMEPSCGAVYAVAKSNNNADEAGLNTLLEQFKKLVAPTTAHAQTEWQYHINGNNLSIMPGGINKAAAVSYLLTQWQAQSNFVTIGVGDSTSDLAFMRLCDLWLTPTQSQLDQCFSQAASTSTLHA